MSQAATLEWTIPEDVQSFAEEQGVAAYLPAMLEITDRVFPKPLGRAVVVDDDPEIAGDRHIVFEVDVAMTVEESLVADRQWHEAALQCCPTTLICVFRLSVELVNP